MSENKGYYLQSDPECMDLYYLEYDGERAPEDIRFVYSRSNIHDLEDLIDLLNKKNDECITLDKHISFLDERNAMLEKEINRLKNEIMLSEKTRDVSVDVKPELVEFDQFNHEANKKLTLKDYDIHAHFVTQMIHESDLPVEKKMDALKFIELYRFWIITGNHVDSNIARVNYMVRNVILNEDKPYNRLIIKKEE